MGADNVSARDLPSHYLSHGILLSELSIDGGIHSCNDDSPQAALPNLPTYLDNLLLDDGRLLGAIDVQATIGVTDITLNSRGKVGGPVAEGPDVAQEAA